MIVRIDRDRLQDRAVLIGIDRFRNREVRPLLVAWAQDPSV